jgi:hypothetical protein
VTEDEEEAALFFAVSAGLSPTEAVVVVMRAREAVGDTDYD